MGEIAEMMLDGTLCQGCGQYIGDACDYPRTCIACAGEGFDGIERPQPSPAKVNCPQCGKRVKQAGLHDHVRDVHGSVAGPNTKEG